MSATNGNRHHGMERRHMLLAAAAILGLAFAFARATPAITEWNMNQRVRAQAAARELAALRSSLGKERLQRLIAAQDDIVRARAEWFFEPADGVQSEALLARRLQEAAEDAGAELLSVQPMAADTTRANHRRLRARAAVSGDLETVTLFLAGIEAGPERIAIRELLLAQPDISIARNRVEVIRGELVVEGIVADSPAVRP